MGNGESLRNSSPSISLKMSPSPLNILNWEKCYNTKLLRSGLSIYFFYTYIVDPIGTKRGIALLWKNNVHIQIKSLSSNDIEVEVYEIGKPRSWIFVGFYGEPWLDNKWRSQRLLNWLG